MHSRALPQPGLIWGRYPERRTPGTDPEWGNRLNAAAMRLARPNLRPYLRLAHDSLDIERGLAALAEPAFDAAVRDLKRRLAREGLTHAALAHAFALTGEACRRRVGMTPYATQRVAAAIMLDNQLAEMATGEGKTLVAALTAATAAMAGIPVHVITANDYLVARDAAKMQPVYAALGLSVGAVQQSHDSRARAAEYARDITYCTAKELVFDYLRDQPARRGQRTGLAQEAAHLAGAQAGTLLRGLCMAVVDEADSILIDEARVPLVISELHDQPDRAAAHAQALRLAAALEAGEDYTLDRHAMSATLSPRGHDRIEAAAREFGPVWHNRRHRGETVGLALAALHLFERDRHYLVRDDAVHIIDETTGRVAPGRTWSRGLHALIEMKEGCKPRGEPVTRAQITFQRFFPRYHRLCGMSGTLAESKPELARVYGLNVVRVPLNRPARRIDLGLEVYANRPMLWHAVAERIAAVARTGRPVLVGTDSVADSDSLSAHLERQGIAHTVLNARNDREEAAIVALAGHAGRVTVTTNMAGRGTDIPLGPGVADAGGLHVISCQLNSARRIDRQLKGRCARQGDPGSVETLLSFDSPLMLRALPAWLMRLAMRFVEPARGRLPRWAGRACALCAQRIEESRQQAQRAMLLHHDRQLGRQALFRE